MLTRILTLAALSSALVLSSATHAQSTSSKRGPEVHGLHLGMSPEQIRKTLAKEFGALQWDTSTLKASPSQVVYRYWYFAKVGDAVTLAYGTDLDGRVVRIVRSQIQRTTKSLDDILKPALDKFGVPYHYSVPEQGDRNDFRVASYGMTTSGEVIRSPEQKACFGSDHAKQPDCLWSLEVWAMPETGVTGQVTVRTVLAAPSTETAAYRRALNAGGVSGVTF